MIITARVWEIFSYRTGVGQAVKNPLTLLIGVVIAIVLLSYMFLFQVRYDQRAVLATFGKATDQDIRQPRSMPYLRWPWPAQRVEAYPTTLQMLESQAEEVTTADQFNIVLSVYVIWKIEDPLKFFTIAETIGNAQGKLRSSLENVKNVVSTYRFDQLVNSDPAKVQLPAIEQAMLQQMSQELDRQNFGVSVEQVGVRRILLPQATTSQVAEAMKKTRLTQAQVKRSEGQAQAESTKAEAQKISDQILAFAESSAETIRAEGDAAANQYVGVFQRNQEFAIFLQRLNSYRQFLSKYVTVALPTEDMMSPGKDLLKDEAR